MKIVIPAIAALILFVGFYAWYGADDTLDPEVRAWLEPPSDRTREPGNGYLYLIGILAGEGQDPAETGLRLLGAGDPRAEEQSYFRAEFREEDLPVPPMRLPESPLLCVRGQAGCVEELLAHTGEAAPLIEQHRELLARYQAFLRHTHYQTASGREARRLELSYGALTTLNRLNHLAILRELAEGNPARAAAALADDVAAVRAMLPRVDDFMLKLTLALALVEDYRLLSEFHARGLLPPESIGPDAAILEPLTVAERSIEADMRRRLRDHADDVIHFRGRRERRGNVFDPFGWSRKLVHKPNRTLNESFPRFHRNYRLSVLDPAGYLEELRKPFDDRVRIERDNFVGSVLNRKAVSNFEGYIGTLHDLDSFIKLVRIRVALPPGTPVKASAIAELAGSRDIGNPYDGKPPFVAPERHALCYTSRRSGYGGGDLCVSG